MTAVARLGPVGLAAVLLVLLALREAARVSGRPGGPVLARRLGCALVPLLAVFFITVALRIAAVIR